ncbi:MAG: DMT family transporter [Lachnospiraceae bacterium]|nr:DMT family transporter [Lachnospiraceae bacterium]
MNENPMNAGENQADSSSLGKKCIVILGVVGVSFSAILVKNSTAPSMVLVFYRMFLAALLLTVPGIAALRRERSAVTGKLLLCCLISGFFLALHFTLYFEAGKYTSIASALLLVDTEVFFVAFATLFFFREKIPQKAWIGILVTFVGSVIVGMGDAGGGSDAVRGDLCALLGSACMAVYTIMGKICRKSLSTTLYTTIVYWVAVVTTVILLSIQTVPLFGYGGEEILRGFGMAVLCTLLGHSVFSWGLRYVSASFISTAKLMEPVFASILGILFFREIPGAAEVIGGLVILAGIYYYTIQKEA